MAPDSVEAAESAAARVAAARVAAAAAAEDDPGLTPREAGVGLLEIHAAAHTSNHDIVARRWSKTVKRLRLPGSGPFALMLLTHDSKSLFEWRTIVGKATKSQLQEGEARRGLEAARVVLPVSGADHRG